MRAMSIHEYHLTFLPEHPTVSVKVGSIPDLRWGK